ncbi:molybdopterin-dependent aldehyde oxidoreductase [Acetobacterium woodii]|uniref:Aldehyde oxidoreductase Mop1 n=1 Tax=Acetobacterium woodii (strain ATCC 29683 / DSM 1030 / JCM 2381 / KCTC 1655 / WB1) TaxID=931626 RepID=H6LHL1_ACEWD|nr:molybdopterin-dependent aldehyde oxidoreductase [Acetobacterium woodii]AFA47190.1 aldehyde oxidoreductase Mop1 [Acetobacterium woodii DSM 1030]
MLKKMFLNINGSERMIVCEPEVSLADTLRQLGLTGVKVGCGNGQCGACSVILDGKVVRSCTRKMKNVPEYSQVITIEGIGTPTHLHALQLAWLVHGGAQCGFCTPGFIVSAKGLLDTNINPTRDEVRAWFQKHRNACRCTGYKQLVDAVMDAAKVVRGEMTMKELSFKIPLDGRIYNSNIPKPTALAKVTGTCDYGADLNLKLPKDTLHLAMVNAKVSHANIIAIDTSEAEKMPGVERILTSKDIKGTNRVNGLCFMPNNKSDGYDRCIINDKKVYQYGDVLALVIADTETNARAAADQVKVELEVLPAYMNGLDAIAEDAIEIHPGTPNLFLELPIVKGAETAAIMENAPYVVEGSFYTSHQPHLVLEPDVGMAYYDEEGRLTVQGKGQFLQALPLMYAQALGIEPEKIRVIENPVGASFGSKMSGHTEALMMAAAMATKRTVCMRFDYAQQSYFSGKRSASYYNVKLAADKNGKLIGMEEDFLFDHGAYHEATSEPLLEKGLRFCGAGYQIPNIRGVGRICASNQAFGIAFRAFGSPQALMATESLMDMLAEKMGKDPLELRYENALRSGDTMPSGCELDVHPLPKLLEMMRPKYQLALERARNESTAEIKRGVGLSIGLYDSSFAANDFAEIDIELNPDGSVTHYSGWHDQGQGADAGALVLVHEALKPLGIDPAQIRLVMNDTLLTPFTGAAAGSRSHYMAGKATIDGAQKLIAAMEKEDGSYRTYEEMIAEKRPTKYRGFSSTGGYSSECDLNTLQGNPNPTYTYGVFMAETAVNTKTGKTKVVKMTLHCDFGTIGNKLAVDGQMYGGLAQGIGLALSEDFYDPEKHTTLIAQGFPFIEAIPDELEVEYTETYRDSGPFGSCGCAELPLTSPHVAICNAIYNAVGVRLYEVPVLPEKLLEGINKLEKGEVIEPPEQYYFGSEMDEVLENFRKNPIIMPEK